MDNEPVPMQEPDFLESHGIVELTPNTFKDADSLYQWMANLLTGTPEVSRVPITAIEFNDGTVRVFGLTNPKGLKQDHATLSLRIMEVDEFRQLLPDPVPIWVGDKQLNPSVVLGGVDPIAVPWSSSLEGLGTEGMLGRHLKLALSNNQTAKIGVGHGAECRVVIGGKDAAYKGLLSDVPAFKELFAHVEGVTVVSF